MRPTTLFVVVGDAVVVVVAVASLLQRFSLFSCTLQVYTVFHGFSLENNLLKKKLHTVVLRSGTCLII